MSKSSTALLLFGMMLLTWGCSSHASEYGSTREVQAAEVVPETPVVAPGEGYGLIALGMARSEVLERVGEPDFQPAAQADQYGAGFAVLYDKQSRVQMILCGGWCDKDDPMVRAFRGDTRSGLSMGSSRSDIELAMGPADSVKEVQQGLDFLVLRYDVS